MTQRLPHELTIHTTDSVGQELDVVFGIVVDAQGHQRMALSVGDGPTAMLNYNDGTGPNILPIARRTLAALIKDGTP